MKICPQCNSSNRDEAKFCTKCGENLGVQSLDRTDSTDTKPVQDNAATDSKPTDIPVSQPVVENAVPSESQPTVSSPRKKSTGLFIVAGIAVIAIVFLLIRLVSNASPVNKLLKGLSKLSKMNEFTAITTIDVNYDGDSEEGELLNDMIFKAEMAADTDDLLAQITLELIYDKKSVTQLAAGVNNEDVYVDLKDLYKNVLYQDIEDLLPDYKDYLNDYKLIKKAIDEISLKFDNKEYIKIIKDTLDDDIKGSGNKVTLTLNSKTMTRLMEKLLKEAQDDKKLMESIRKNGINLIKRILKDEKKFEKLEVDELEEVLEIFEDKDDFEDYYDDLMSSALQSMEYTLSYSLDSIKDLDITFVFGASGNIKEIEYSVMVDADGDDLEILFSSEIKSGAKFTKFNRNKAIVIEELMNDYDELEEVAEEVTENLIKAVKKNKKLTNKIEDLSGEDVEDAIEYMMYNIFSFMYW